VSADSTELGVRPEHLEVVAPEDPAASFKGAVTVVERLGNSTLIYVDTPAGQLIVEGKGNLEVKPGEPVGLKVIEAQAHLFGPTGAVL
jgi:ABC-type sugar transport system ATPase subunit